MRCASLRRSLLLLVALLATDAAHAAGAARLEAGVFEPPRLAPDFSLAGYMPPNFDFAPNSGTWRYFFGRAARWPLS